LKWHDLETYAFVHFGPNTFTGKEWGEGSECPDLFQPSELDCNQWCEAFLAAGYKGVVLTCKHHDGFCLWPSRQSTHTVRESSWRQGKGDILKELAVACARAGLKLGVYVSPWDRNHPAYGTDAYNDVFVATLEEVLTGYGPVFEVWFDGANGEGPNGRRQTYDWPRFVDTVRKHQPDAVIFSDAGPDVRWVGNEQGYANETNWAPLQRDRYVPGTPLYRELGSGQENGTHWVPAECNFSIRPGWFYRTSEDDKVKSPQDLFDRFLGSVGRNGSHHVNVPPDKRGLIHDRDIASLRGFRALHSKVFGVDLAQGARTEAPEVLQEGWLPYCAVSGPITLQLQSNANVGFVSLRESIPLGQRVRAFALDAWQGNEWREVAKGSTIGARRIVNVGEVTGNAWRLRVLDSRAQAAISRISLHPPAV
jgi:alpha-L-fucosidase